MKDIRADDFESSSHSHRATKPADQVPDPRRNYFESEATPRSARMYTQARHDLPPDEFSEGCATDEGY